MRSAIHILDQHAANQIAAGEVVERPVSVIKELVENALDAKAEIIEITVEGNGLPLMRIRDNGFGIKAEELPIALLRHATSKITKIDDLDQLITLGFRGEALPSIASVAVMEIVSRTQEDIAGTYLKVEGGNVIERKEIGCPIGTTVSVSDLFYNTPTRRKFLRSPNTEFGQISDLVTRLALSRPDVAFTLTHPRQVVLKTSGSGELVETIGAVLGNDIARKLIPVSYKNPNWELSGYISPPNLVRSNKQSEFFIVNGRVIRSNFLSRALHEGYHTLIPAKLNPIAVLHLKLPPSDYDVNVHPTKMDIRFKDEKELSAFITASVQEVLRKSYSLPPLWKDVENSKTFQSEIYSQYDYRLKTEDPGITLREKFEPKNIPSTHESNEAKEPLENQEDKYSIEKNDINETQNSKEIIHNGINNKQDIRTVNLEQKQDVEYQKIPFKNLDFEFWPLAQLFNTYILATDGKVFVIIDQHAAHERINYEKYLRKIKEYKNESQELLIPVPLEFTLQEEQILLEHLWALRDMGFILEQFGPKTYLLRGIPEYLGSLKPEIILRQFIDEVLQKQTSPNFDQLIEEWIYLVACKESIKAKENMNIFEMEQLLSELNQTSNPYTCPHGRPTMIKMTRSELEKRFYRS